MATRPCLAVTFRHDRTVPCGLSSGPQRPEELGGNEGVPVPQPRPCYPVTVHTCRWRVKGLSETACVTALHTAASQGALPWSECAGARCVKGQVGRKMGVKFSLPKSGANRDQGWDLNSNSNVLFERGYSFLSPQKHKLIKLCK